MFDARSTSLAAGVAMFIAVMALVGWALDADPLTSVVTGWATLKVNTAIAIAASALALLRAGAWRTGWTLVSAALAAAALAAWFAGVDLGLDELLVADPASALAGQPPGRMAVATALGLWLVAGAIGSAERAPRASQALAAAGLGLAWVALLGYACELAPLSSVWLYGSVSLPTALALVALGLGALSLRPDRGWVGALTADDPGAALLRRLGPAAVLVPSVTAWLGNRLQRRFDWQVGFAAAVGATLDAVVFAGLLAFTAAAARREARGRADAEREVRDRERRLVGLTHALMSAHEAERRALAHELHDEFGQTLTALGLLVARAGRSAEAAEEARVLLGSLTDGVRRLSLELRPSILDDLGLGPALRWLAGRWPAEGDVSVSVSVSVPVPVPASVPASAPASASGERERRAAPDVEIAAYRIAQEALTNAVRHGGAARVSVSLRITDWLVLEVVDDGRGFAAAATDRHASVGLVGMDERARAVGGRLEITSAPGRTVVRAILPAGTEHR